MKRKFWFRKWFIFRLFRKLPESERIHVMQVLPKKHIQEIEKLHQKSVEVGE